MRTDAELDFEWDVARGGYEWVDMPSDVPGVAYGPEAERYVLRARLPGTKPYRPLRQDDELYREFAHLELWSRRRNVDALKDRIKDFADRYGLLGIPNPFAHVLNAAGEVVNEFGEVINQLRAIDESRKAVRLPTLSPAPAGESLSDWLAEIRAMRKVIELWDLVCCRPADRHRNAALLREEIVWDEGTPMFRRRWEPVVTDEEARRMDWKSGDVVRPARHYLRNVINAHLREELAPHVEWKPDNSVLLLSRAPQTLLGALWLQFARRFCKPITYVTCQFAECGKHFLLSHRRHRGTRADAMFCSDACRMAEYRDRQHQARTLHAQGESVEKIARVLRSTSPTVRRWL